MIIILSDILDQSFVSLSKRKNVVYLKKKLSTGVVPLNVHLSCFSYHLYSYCIHILYILFDIMVTLHYKIENHNQIEASVNHKTEC